jgi:hypothetical protein
MMPGPDTEIAAIKDHDIVLCDATVPRGSDGLPKPAKGDRQLLVRVLAMNHEAGWHRTQARPSVRLETIEKKDTTAPDGRSFGADKRLVIPTRAASPGYRILLFPHRAGDPLPATSWSSDGTELTIKLGDVTDSVRFDTGPDGRARVTLRRDGKPDVSVK